MTLRRMLEKVLSFLIPFQCPCCKRFLGEGEKGICPGCLSEFRWIEPPFCSVCGAPFVSKEGENHPCSACLTGRRYFTMARALGIYQDPLLELIHQWKYEGKIFLTSYLGKWVVDGFSRHWDPHQIDLLIPVPLHPKRLRERGFNQALLLVREISRGTGIPFRKRALQKIRNTLPQVNLSGVEREKGVKGAFFLSKIEEVEGKSVLLVDDVYTTGATVNECAKVLLTGGARRVDVLTLAHALKRL